MTRVILVLVLVVLAVVFLIKRHKHTSDFSDVCKGSEVQVSLYF